MTIFQLYEWACNEGVEDCDLIVNDSDGCMTHYIEPTIERHKCADGTEYIEVEL